MPKPRTRWILSGRGQRELRRQPLREEQRIRAWLKELEEYGVVSIDGDRFRLIGDEFVTVYTKYATVRHAQTHHHDNGPSDRSFARTVTDAILEAAFSTVSQQSGQLRPTRIQTSREIGQAPARSAGAIFRDRVESGDIAQLGAFTPIAILLDGRHRSALPRRPNLDVDHIGMGFRLQVGIEIVDVLEFMPSNGAAASDLQISISSWFADNRELLRKFDATLEELVVVDLPSQTLRATAEYSWAFRKDYTEEMWEGFSDGRYSEALEVVLRALEAMRPYVTPYIGRSRLPQHSEAFSDILNRAGFLTLLEDRFNDAKAFIEESLAASDNEAGIKFFNLGICELFLGDCDAATAAFSTALNDFRSSQRSSFAYLRMAIELPDELAPETSLVAEVEGDWAVRFAELHLLLAQLRSKRLDFEMFLTECDTLLGESEVPAYIARVIAWEAFRNQREDEVSTLLDSRRIVPQEDVYLMRDLSFIASHS